MSNKRLNLALVTIAAMALAAPAAAFTTYLFDGAGGCSGGGTGVRTCTNGGITAEVTAHAFTAGSPDNTVVNGAFLGVYGGGLGVRALDTPTDENTKQPHHALSNDFRFEFIRVDFGTKVSLTEVHTGWVDVDADITVLAHNGGGGDTNPNGENIAALAANGWSLVAGKHYPGGSGDDDTQQIPVNPGGAVESRYWLIGAFDPDFGGNFNGADRNPSQGKFDYLKVYAVKWDKPTDAAEPATLLLLAAGLIAWSSSRRRTARI